MTTGQAHPEPFYCPRCKGLMQKLAGSVFYWHAHSNRPACEITNLADPNVRKSVETTENVSGKAIREQVNRK